MSVQNGAPRGAFAPNVKNKHTPAFQAVLAAADGKKAPPWNFSESFKSGVHGYARWMRRRAAKIAVGLHLTKEPTPMQLIQQARVMCKEYIFSRLRTAGLMTSRLEAQAPSRPSDVSLEIQAVGEHLERMYPDLYRQLSRQLNMTFSSARVVEDTFTAVATEMLKQGPVTWGKVVALFSLAAGFAVDCVSQGHSAYVSDVVEAFTKFVSQHLVKWLLAQGGWVDIVRTFRASKDASVLWVLSACGAIFGFAATLMSVVDHV